LRLIKTTKKHRETSKRHGKTTERHIKTSKWHRKTSKRHRKTSKRERNRDRDIVQIRRESIKGKMKTGWRLFAKMEWRDLEKNNQIFLVGSSEFEQKVNLTDTVLTPLKR